MSEKITVIIPTFKRDDKFERALKSVLCQTYDNIEIIVVDDNADFPEYRRKVEEIVFKYKNKVLLIQNNENLGGALSRNVGVKESSGNLIAFLDDDDEYIPNKISEQYKLYRRHSNDNSLGLIFCNNGWIDYNQNIIYQHMKKIIATTSTWLIPKSIIVNLGYFERLPSEQDTTFILKLLCAGYKVFGLSEELVVRHFHASDEGISGVKLKNIVGSEMLRERCRLNYDKLDNEKQASEVEFCFSKKLLPMYIYNHKRDDAVREMKNMLTIKPFSLDTLKGLVRFMFPKYFVYRWYSKK